jgi:hypothetical protein
MAIQQTWQVLAALGVNRWVDSIRWGLAPPPWQGRTFGVFLLVVERLI